MAVEQLNYVFFEEYKRLDKLCGDLYGEQYGISCYVENMKASMSNDDYRKIPSWTSDLQQLVRCRHIRNHLAHTEGSFHEKNCTQEDIAWIQNFYERILSRNDSLAMLYRYSEEKQKIKSGSHNQYDVQEGYQKNALAEEQEEWQNSYWIILFLIIICVLGVIVAIGYYLI